MVFYEKILKELNHAIQSFNDIIHNLYKLFHGIPKVEPITSDDEKKFNEEFGRIANKFAFLYEDTYQFLCNKGILGEEDAYSLAAHWDQNIRIYSKEYVILEWKKNLKHYFKKEVFIDVEQLKVGEIRDMLYEWFEKIKKAGIKRDEQEKFNVENYTAHQNYIIEDLYDIGDQIIIKSPCWMLGDQCIEKGVGDVVKNDQL